TITGRLGMDPELRFTPNGKAVANFSVADTPRRLNRDTQQWEDAGETLWLRGSLWGTKAEALAEHARKGHLVTVTGRLEARSWEDRQTGDKRTVTEIAAQEVAVVPRSSQSSGGGTDFAQAGGWGGGTGSGGAPPAPDPWGA